MVYPIFRMTENGIYYSEYWPGEFLKTMTVMVSQIFKGPDVESSAQVRKKEQLKSDDPSFDQLSLC